MSILHLSTKDNDSLPEYDENIKCPEHPTAEVASGFGLAGGGMGSYTLCDTCCKILSKTLIADDEA